MTIPTLIMVGGFLGAGKTTLIARAAALLAAAGKRVVVVTNDQAPDLVDTAVIRLAGIPAAEVSGACFCCAFPDFVAKTEQLIAEHRPDVVIAEPVGSCVDIAATVLRPIAASRGDVLRIAPFTVCVDPAGWRMAEDGGGGMDASTVYIYRQQTLEADLVLLTKADTEPATDVDLIAELITARNPVAGVQRCSAATGAGVQTWLDGVLAASAPGGQQRIAVDYDVYAAGEAALGWLNATVELTGPADWPAVLDRLMGRVNARCTAAGAAPAHLKCLLASAGQTLVANVVAGRPQPQQRVLAGGQPAATARLTINARVPMQAAQLRELITAALDDLDVRGTVKTIRAFPPGRPVPVHRLA